MIKRAISWCLPGLLVLSLLMPVSVEARTHGGIASSGIGCPFGSSTPDIDNGCSTSSGGSVQHSTFFAGYANQNGQTYPSRPQRNQAGIDFPVGMPLISSSGICGKDNMVDPAVATVGTGCGQIQTGCAYFATGAPAPISNTGIPTVYCTGVTNPVIQGFDFKENGTHGAVTVAFNPATITGSITVQFNDFKTGVNDQFMITVPAGPTYSTNNLVLKSNSMDGAWQTYGAFATFTSSQTGTTLTVNPGVSGTITVNQKLAGSGSLANNFVVSQLTGTTGKDGTYLVSQSSGVTDTAQTNSSWQSVGFVVNTTGSFNVTYNSFTNFNGRPGNSQRVPSSGWAGGTVGDDYFAYNYTENMCFTTLGNTAHCETFQGVVNNAGSTIWNNVTYLGNTCLQGNSQAIGGTTACFYPNTGQPVGQIASASNTTTNLVMKNNVAVTNSNAAQQTTSGALYNTAYQYYTNTSVVGNWLDKNGSINYGYCSPGAYTSGVLTIAQGTGSLDQTPSPNTMHITAFTGPFNFTLGWHVFNYDRYITAILTGTGGIGTYTLDKTPVTVGSAAVKAYPDTFVNTPIVTDNHDLTQSGASNINSLFFVAGGDLTNCMSNTH